MPQKRRFKLLLDEMWPSRSSFPLTNYYHDLKHIALDLKSGGISDNEVAKKAKVLKRIVITRNIKHYKNLVSQYSIDIFGVSPNLTIGELDKKLLSKLKQWPKAAKGRFEIIG